MFKDLWGIEDFSEMKFVESIWLLNPGFFWSLPPKSHLCFSDHHDFSPFVRPEILGILQNLGPLPALRLSTPSERKDIA